MAKRKTPKKDKIVDFKIKADKITSEELTKLQSLVKASNQGQMQLGRLELQKYGMIQDIEELRNHTVNLQKEFIEKYGSYDISIEDGSINYPEDAKVNS